MRQRNDMGVANSIQEPNVTPASLPYKLKIHNIMGFRSGQVRGGYAGAARRRVHLRYSFGLRLAIAQADARPAMPVSFR